MRTEQLFYILLSLGSKFGNLFIFAFVLTKLKAFRRIVSKEQLEDKDKIILSIIFGIFGIIGTYFSFEHNGALINTRIIGVAAGGLFGGPFVGFFSGLIAGIHRLFMSTGTTTATACAISTVLEGTMAGFMGLYMKNRKIKWHYALLTGAIAESMRKIMLLIMVKPFSVAVDLVKDIWIPMVVINSIGLAIFFIIIENVFKDRERAVAKQAQLSLRIVEESLPFLRIGYESNGLKNVANIILKRTSFDAVSFTDREKIIAHAGCVNQEIMSGKNLLLEQQFSQVATVSNFRDLDCELKSELTLPLRDGEQIVGTLKLYKNNENAITNIDAKLGEGLANLISTELRISKLENLSKLVKDAEIKALQAQINPHFLFNSLTVIGSLCRTKPEKARELIISLSKFFRKNLNNNKQLVPIAEEIEHVQSYVEIEKARLNDDLVFDYEINKDVDFLLPPLTLQPLVENAIKHGVYPKKGKGIVTFSISAQSNEVVVCIKDNGVGINKEKLEQLRSLNKGEGNSYGLSNVINRLKKHYGDAFGWEINSIPNTGTDITLRIPR